MPCSYTGSPERDALAGAESQIKTLVQELDVTTRLLCFLSRRFEKVNPSVFGGLLKENPELQSWVVKHNNEDAQRWFSFYKTEYPNYSLEEISKAVRSGMLKEV